MSLNPRSARRREVRAERVIARGAVELAASVVGLRRCRRGMEQLFADKMAEGDAMAAARLSDSLVKIAEMLHRMCRHTSKQKSMPRTLDLEPMGLAEEPLPEPSGPGGDS